MNHNLNKMGHTDGSWTRGDVPAKYKSHPETEAKKELLKMHGLDAPFECVSIGNYNAQIALIPTDNKNHEANAKLIAAAPDMIHALIEISKELSGMNLSDNIERAKLRVNNAIRKAILSI